MSRITPLSLAVQPAFASRLPQQNASTGVIPRFGEDHKTSPQSLAKEIKTWKLRHWAAVAAALLGLEHAGTKVINMEYRANGLPVQYRSYAEMAVDTVTSPFRSEAPPTPTPAKPQQ